ncbi:MAG TPA: PEGA domain-containing protein, partial [Polyangia bacterium]|nr:PEGA domain-containing protein [Polyangia bacterium]
PSPSRDDDQAQGSPVESGSHRPSKEKAPQIPVVIKSDPEGSHVATGRHQFGTTPLTLKLRPGNSYDLTFTRAGYVAITRHYKLEAHGPQTFRVSLKKLPEPKKPAAPAVVAPKAAPPPAKKNNFFSR